MIQLILSILRNLYRLDHGFATETMTHEAVLKIENNP